MNIKTEMEESTTIQTIRFTGYDYTYCKIWEKPTNYKKIDGKWYIIGSGERDRVSKNELRKRLVLYKNLGYIIIMKGDRHEN